MSGCGFCTHCGHRVESFDGLSACPACGSKGVPCSDKEQVQITINWHELRLLVIWAENYGRTLDLDRAGHKPVDTVYAIARRIEDQHPDRALDSPLSLAGELRQVADRFNAKIYPAPLADDVQRFKRLNEPPVEPAP